MIYYKNNKEKPENTKEILSFIKTKYSSEILFMSERPKKFKKITKSFFYIEETNKLIFLVRDNNNTYGPRPIAPYVVDALIKGYDVEILTTLKMSSGKNHNELMFYRNFEVQISFINESWNIESIMPALPDFVEIDNDSKILSIYEYYRDDEKRSGKAVIKQDLAYSSLWAYYYSKVGFSIEVVPMLEENDRGQSGFTGILKKTIELISNSEKIKLYSLMPTTENLTYNSLNTTELEKIAPITEEKEIQVGSRIINNNHEIMMFNMMTKLIGQFGDSAKIVRDTENGMDIDILVLFPGENNIISKAKIVEVKSFNDNKYYKALGQLLVYEEKLSKSYNINKGNIEKILLLPIEKVKLTLEFEKTVKNNNITIERI